MEVAAKSRSPGRNGDYRAKWIAEPETFVRKVQGFEQETDVGERFDLKSKVDRTGIKFFKPHARATLPKPTASYRT